MSTVDFSEMIWAKMPKHPWLPGRICTEEVPGNLITRVCTDESAKCVFFFGIHEYAWINQNEIFNYQLYRKYYEKQRLQQFRRKCLDIAMNEADRYINEPSFKSSLLGYIQKTANNANEALRLYSDAIRNGQGIDPITFFEYLHCTRIVCNWNKYENNVHLLSKLVKDQLKKNDNLCIDTHTALFYPFSPLIHKAIAQYWAKNDERDVNYWQRNYKFTATNSRIKIGYVSSDFRDHATSHLFQSIPGLHERKLFEVYCFALNHDDGSAYYRKIANESEHFIDLSQKNDAQAADRINSLDIDILVNMNGHTEGGRNEIFALKPAPIQALWLGFPCTMGAKFMDYFIGDTIATPIEFSSHYSETLAQLPHSYFVGDHKQMFPHLIEKIYLVENIQNCITFNAIILNGIGLINKFDSSKIVNIVCGASKNPIRAIESPTLFNRIYDLKKPLINAKNVQILNGTTHSGHVLVQNIVFTTRAQYGLKTHAIVFCNFNQLSKLDPSTFESWLKIISAVPNSILWLLRYPKDVENNLWTAAMNLGFTESHRIVFSDITSKEEHVRRCQLADLCLDTIICNGHSTTLDVLWSGTPVVTVAGLTLASRASASILNAMGLSELIAKNLNDFEQIAIRLGNNPIKLRNYRLKLNEMLLNSPVFDCEHFTRDLESLYIRMWQIYALGKPPKLLTNPKCVWD